MVSETNKINKIKSELINYCKSIIISVIDNNFSDIGYAPYIYKDNFFYVFSSELSSHIRVLLIKRSGTFMLIEDEKGSQNIWARKRIKFQAKISIVISGSAEFNEITDLISAKHGNTINLIKEFKDFHLIKIIPNKGTIITGFGSAYYLKGLTLEIDNKIKGLSK